MGHMQYNIIDKYNDIGTYWIAFYVSNDQIMYFGSFSFAAIPNGIKKFIDNQNIEYIY